jgi:hypothetical protein
MGDVGSQIECLAEPQLEPQWQRTVITHSHFQRIEKWRGC